MPRARKYTKKISIYADLADFDDFGGSTLKSVKLLDVWANLKTLDKFKYRNVDFGDIDMANSLMVTIRKRSDFNLNYKSMYFVYRNYKYMISERPINSDFNDAEISFIAIRENDIIEEFNLFDVYTNYAQSVLNETDGTLQPEACTIAQIKDLL